MASPNPMELVLSGSSATANGDIELASKSAVGVKGNGESFHAQLSSDGTKVAFHSLSTNLTPQDGDVIKDVFIKDLVTGDIKLASTSDAGVKGNRDSGVPFLTSDGTQVTFVSSATNLDPGDGDEIVDVYVKNLLTGDIRLTSTSAAGVKSNGDAAHPSLSADGNRIAFYSYADNLHPADTDRSSDIFVKNLATGNVILASSNARGVPANGESTIPMISANGERVAFGSTATNLHPKDTDSKRDLYVKNLVTGAVKLASTSDAGVKGNGHSVDPWVSSDGREVSFASSASNLDPSDRNIHSDIYVKNLATGDIRLASSTAAGRVANDSSYEASLSGDGTRVAFFSRATNLDPVDTDSVFDVYLKDLSTGDIELFSTSDTGQKGNGASGVPALSADGATVAFHSSASNLDPADADVIRDVYVKSGTSP
jgi:WD40-like Beta Propeller Repeat